MVITPRYANPKGNLTAQLRQEALQFAAECSSPFSSRYYLDGRAGAAFVYGGVEPLWWHTTAFQAELTTVLLALHHTGEGHVAGFTCHVFTDSLVAIGTLQQTKQ